MRGDRAKVKELLRRRGSSAAWLGRQMGMERSHFEHILRGDFKPPKRIPYFWERIAAILGVAPSEIAADEPERVA